MNILIGADPELFLTDKEGAKSAYGVIPGNKKAPHIVTDGAVQVDGMALEFNIEPADSKEKFIYNINSVLSTLREMVPNTFEMSIIPTALFDPEYLRQQPKEALALGCDPDYNAYTQKLNPNPKAPKGHRSAGGHIHIGWTMDENPLDTSHFLSCCQLVKQLDYYLGIPSIIFDRDHIRRQTYGQGGAFRPKHYGVEYRVLSNFWLKDERLIDFVYTMTKRAFDNLIDGLELEEREVPNKARSIINSCQYQTAFRFMQRRADIYGDFIPLAEEYYKGLAKPSENKFTVVKGSWQYAPHAENARIEAEVRNLEEAQAAIGQVAMREAQVAMRQAAMRNDPFAVDEGF